MHQFASSNRRRFDRAGFALGSGIHIKAPNPMKFAVQVEAEDAEALDRLISATEKWLKKSMGATVLESTRDDEDLIAAYVVSTRKDLSSTFLDANLPGKVSVEPLD